jgi:hypothetical protein
MNKPSAFHASLHSLDTETQTFGCRHSTPYFCAKNCLPKVCALIRPDKICFAPPSSWAERFKKLQTEKSTNN